MMESPTVEDLLNMRNSFGSMHCPDELVPRIQHPENGSGRPRSPDEPPPRNQTPENWGVRPSDLNTNFTLESLPASHPLKLDEPLSLESVRASQSNKDRSFDTHSEA